MAVRKKISGTSDAWESGELGRDEDHAVRVELDENKIDEAAGLQLISIRLQKSLIDDFKIIAKINGIGYQTLMRQILKRFADAEIKLLVRECVLNAQEQAERERQLQKMNEKKKRA